MYLGLKQHPKYDTAKSGLIPLFLLKNEDRLFNKTGDRNYEKRSYKNPLL